MSKRMLIPVFAILIGWTALTASVANADDPFPPPPYCDPNCGPYSPPRYRELTRYYHDPEKTQWAGYLVKECNGEVIMYWGELTQYSDFGRVPCDD
jgi:hypothetical protein